MAKRKSKKATSNGSGPIPCGAEPDLRLMALAQERLERDCWRNFQELQRWVAEDDKWEQLYELADKGFQEAQAPRKCKRWPLLNNIKKTDLENDLPQAVCILFMFHDIYQEDRGCSGDPLIGPEMRVEYGAVIGELREDVEFYYYHNEGLQDEVDLFTVCIVLVKEHVSNGTVLDEPKNDKPQQETISTQKELKTDEETEISWQGKTLALLVEHRDWPVDKIASEVGKSRKTLYHDPTTGKAIKARNEQKRKHSPRY